MASVREKAVPLEKSEISEIIEGKSCNKPALSPLWVTKVEYPVYSFPTQPDPELSETWLAEIQNITDQLQWLLSLPYHVFWSQVLHGPSELFTMLESYLTNAPRCSDDPTIFQSTLLHPDKKVSEAHTEIHRLILRTYARLATSKEDETHFISEDFHANLLCKHHIFDIATMLDLCAVYGRDNKEFIGKMLAKLFKTQPKYFTDLQTVSSSILEKLDKVEEEIRAYFRRIRNLSPEARQRLSIEEYIHFVRFIADVALTLSVFLDCAPERCFRIFDEAGFTKRIPHFVDTAVMTLVSNYARLSTASSSSELCKMPSILLLCLNEFITLFRRLLDYNYLRALVSDTSPSEGSHIDERMQAYMEVMLSAIDSKDFIYVYESTYAFAVDQVCLMSGPFGAQIDAEQLQFLSDSIEANMQSRRAGGVSKAFDSKLFGERPSENGEASSSKDGSRQVIENIRAIFPHLSEKAIEIALGQNGYNEEKTVNAILNAGIDEEASTHREPEVKAHSLESRLERIELSKKRGMANVLDDRREIDEMRKSGFFAQRAYETPDILKYEVLQEDGEVVLVDLVDGILAEGARARKQNELNRPVPEKVEEENGEYEDEFDDTYDAIG